MKDLGSLSCFLGLEVIITDDGIYLSQAKYVSDLVARAGIIDSLGGLVYLTVTRPDIAYLVHVLNQFLSAPPTTYYVAVLRILHYIEGTLFHDLYFSAYSSLSLHTYSDADWVDDPTDHRSTTGYCLFLGDSLIFW
ncbi:uncharacterized mitochondrial protein AtMg00810-like [Arachis hypogaea]|uniref:uncharacterized mitochondrial protein AtMg00810-like n=1 Tax=Arachis hypogaea TaxID=3818 RepID=UPI003B21E0E3